jgi:hypothetical protein
MLRHTIRLFSKLPEKVEKPVLQYTERSLMFRSFYRFTNKIFPKMLPRLMRFEWQDLVIYCEVFFVGLMVYIHFIDP